MLLCYILDKVTATNTLPVSLHESDTHIWHNLCCTESSMRRVTHKKSAYSTSPSSTVTPSRAWSLSSGPWGSSRLTSGHVNEQ